MQLLLATIGKMKNGPERALCEQYQARCGWPIHLSEHQAKGALPPARRMEAEGQLLLEATESAARRVVLDERGTQLTSEQFAAQLQRWQDNAATPVAFYIGGADGHAPAVKSCADLTLALGSLTWPHMLARAMLCEQLYRAWSICQNHPYHRQ